MQFTMLKTLVGAKRKMSQAEIDRVVVAQADDDSAWEKPIHVSCKKRKLVTKKDRRLLLGK